MVAETIDLPVILCSTSGESILATLERAAGWYETVSLGRCRLRYHALTAPDLPRALLWYAAQGGKAAWPRNSQALVSDILRALDDGRRELLSGDRGLLIVTTEAFLPHAWHLPNGGAPLGERRWARRYAVLPFSSRLGTAAHEIGHLLFGWPDLVWTRSLETECLMARGAAGALGDHPSPPCAPLLVAAGWRGVVPIGRELTPAELGSDRVGALDWGNSRVLVERRADRAQPRLLVYAGPGPRLLFSVPLTAQDGESSILGLIAGELRRRIPLR